MRVRFLLLLLCCTQLCSAQKIAKALFSQTAKEKEKTREANEEADLLRRITGFALPAKMNGSWTLINENGLVINKKIVFDSISLPYFKDKLVVRKGNKFGILQATLDTIHPLVYDSIYTLGSSFIGKKGEGSYVLSSSSSQKIFLKGALKMQRMDPRLYDGLIKVYFSDGVSVLDSTANWVLPNRYEEVCMFKPGLFLVAKGQRTGLLDTLGKVKIPLDYDVITMYHDSIYSGRKNGSWEYFRKDFSKINQQGDYVLLPDKYGYYRTKRGSSYQLFEYASDREVSNGSYDDYFPIAPHLIAVRKDTLIGLVNREMNLIIAPQYSNIRHINDTLLMVRNDSAFGVINFRNEVLLPLEFSYISPCDYKDDLTGKRKIKYFKVFKGSKCGLANRDGKLVVPMEFADVDLMNDPGLVIVHDRKYFGLYNTYGEKLTDLEFTKYNKLTRFSLLVRGDGKTALYGVDGKMNDTTFLQLNYSANIFKLYLDSSTIQVISQDLTTGKNQYSHTYTNVRIFDFFGVDPHELHDFEFKRAPFSTHETFFSQKHSRWGIYSYLKNDFSVNPTFDRLNGYIAVEEQEDEKLLSAGGATFTSRYKWSLLAVSSVFTSGDFAVDFTNNTDFSYALNFQVDSAFRYSSKTLDKMNNVSYIDLKRINGKRRFNRKGELEWVDADSADVLLRDIYLEANDAGALIPADWQSMLAIMAGEKGLRVKGGTWSIMADDKYYDTKNAMKPVRMPTVPSGLKNCEALAMDEYFIYANQKEKYSCYTHPLKKMEGLDGIGDVKLYQGMANRPFVVGCMKDSLFSLMDTREKRVLSNYYSSIVELDFGFICKSKDSYVFLDSAEKNTNLMEFDEFKDVREDGHFLMHLKRSKRYSLLYKTDLAPFQETCENVSIVADSLLLVQGTDGDYGLSNFRGVPKVECEYHLVDGFRFGLVIFKKKAMYYVFDSKGNQVYESLLPIKRVVGEGLISVQRGKSLYLFDVRTQKRVRSKYSSFYPQNAEGYILASKKGKYKLLDREGRAVKSLKYEYISDFKGDLLTIGSKRGRYYLLRTDGSLVDEVQSGVLRKIGSVHRVGNRYFDLSGNELKKLRGRDITYAGAQGYVALDSASQKYFLLNENGIPTTEPEFDECVLGPKGVAAVKVGAQWGLIDCNGAWQVKPAYKLLRFTPQGNVLFMPKYTYGVYSLSGVTLVNPKFEKIIPIDGTGIAQCINQGKVGYVLVYSGKMLWEMQE
ncbi:MAG: WG repeat-containing protein [Flavobacteriales bacterium]